MTGILLLTVLGVSAQSLPSVFVPLFAVVVAICIGADSSSVGWGILILLFWPITLPWYLIQRHKDRRTNLIRGRLTAVAGVILIAVVLGAAWLIDTGNDRNSMLARAITDGNIADVRLMLFLGADIEHANMRSSESNPIEHAFKAAARSRIDSSRYDIIGLLIKKGVDVNQVFHYSTPTVGPPTPLGLAVGIGNTDLAALLIKNGAEVNVKYDGDTYLHLAVRSLLNSSENYINTIALLLANGADLDAVNDVNDPVIFTAVDRGNTAIIEYLFDRGHPLTLCENSSFICNHSSKTLKNLLPHDTVAPSGEGILFERVV